MEPIKEVSRLRRIERALAVIESMSLNDTIELHAVIVVHEDYSARIYSASDDRKECERDAETAKLRYPASKSVAIVPFTLWESNLTSKIYRMSHAALGKCGAHEHHDETWLQEIDQMVTRLKENRVVDIEQRLNEKEVAHD